MAISKIQYDDKVAINIDSTIPDINKCNASDLNEIKSVVNNNADEIPTISDEYGTSTTDGYSQNYINENTINPSGEPSTSEEDVSSTTFTNTLEAPMNIDLKGNTLQNGTPTPSSPIPINNVSGDNDIVVCGKNLFDKDTGIITPGYYGTNGNLITTDATLSCQSIYIKAKPNTSYTISSNASTLYRMCEYDSSKTFIKRTYNENASTSFTITTGSTTEYIRMGGTLTTALDSLMIIEGNTTPTSYIAYNGTTYNIDLPVENLIYTSPITRSGITFDYDSITGITTFSGKPEMTYAIADLINSNIPAGTYTLSLETPKNFGVGIGIRIDGGNRVAYPIPANTKSITITTTGTITSYDVYITTLNTSTTYNDSFKLQLEKGTKVNSFTPYGTTPIELNKIGTYQDYIYKENDKWYLHKETFNITLDGTESSWATAAAGWYSQSFTSIIKKSSPALSKQYTYTSTTWQSNYTFSINPSGFIAISDNRYPVRTDWINYLINNNIDMLCVLDTPTNTEITYTPLIEQLESIKNAMSKEGTTNVNQVNNDLPFILDLSVFNDTYNGRYESLVEQIPNNDNLVNVGTYVNDNYKVNMLYSHNLFDKNNANVFLGYISIINSKIFVSNTSTIKSLYISCKPNTTYTISKISSKQFTICTSVSVANNTSISNGVNLTTSTNGTLTSGANDKYLVVGYYQNDDTLTEQQILNSIMINEGSEAIPYEPYLTPSINVDGEEIYNANLMNKDIITAGFTSDYTLNTSNTYLDVPTDKVYEQIGTNFEINSNNEIICKKDGFVKVNIHYNFYTIAGTGNKWVTANLYHTQYNGFIILNPTGTQSERLDVTGGDRLVRVFAGDKIKVQVYGTQKDVLRAAYSYITCEYV